MPRLGRSEDLYDSLKLSTVALPAVTGNALTGYVTVDTSGAGNYTTLTAAIAGIGTPTSTTRVVIMIYGNTTEPAGVITIPQFVSVIGSKKDTIITCEGLKIGDGSTLQHRGELRNLFITKTGSGTIGLEIAQADEITIDECQINGFATGIKISGANAGLIYMHNSGVTSSTTAMLIDLVTNLYISGGNFYDNDTVFDVGVINSLTVRGTAFETFDTVLLLDSTNRPTAVLATTFTGCRFLSASGGGSYTCRVIKSLGPNNSYQNLGRGISMRDCNFWLTNAKYLVEVLWTGHLGGGTFRFIAELEGNYIQSADNMTAWFKSDCTAAGFVHLTFNYNIAPDAIAIQDGTDPIVAGLVHAGLEGGSAAILHNAQIGATGTRFTRLNHGLVQLTAGTAGVALSTVSYTTQIYLSNMSASNPGFLWVSGCVPGTAFYITSSGTIDASIIAWMAIDP
jgi:hypothetical protein